MFVNTSTINSVDKKNVVLCFEIINYIYLKPFFLEENKSHSGNEYFFNL